MSVVHSVRGKLYRFGLVAALLAVWTAELSAAPPDLYRIPDLKALENTFADLAEKAKPSVVAIRCYKHFGASPDRGEGRIATMPTSFGSGLIIRADGYILTNQHVIAQADLIKVALSDGNEHEARLVQYDLRSDLAVIQVEAEGLRPVTFGDVEDVRVGYWCFAVGNPFGIAYADGNPSVTFGTVSALGRPLTAQLNRGDAYYGDLIQTSTPINPGNSGGPLFDLNGRVIGIVTAIVSSSGVTEGSGFAIPIYERTRHIIDTLVLGQRVRYGYLGVVVEDAAAAIRGAQGRRVPRGALIMSISEKQGPAAKANLQPNDVVVEFGGVAIEDSDHLVRVVGMTPVGSQALVRYVRGGTPGETTVVLAERPTADQAHQVGDEEVIETRTWKGAVLAEMNNALLRRHRLRRANAGLVVTEVDEDSQAYRAGLRAHDIILRCNGARVRDLAEFEEALTGSPRTFRLDLFPDKRIHLPG